jgi:RNA polymerase sigma factor (sigma-70 family)
MPVDAAVLAALVDEIGGSLRAFAATWSHSPDDLVQEAFCRLVAQDALPTSPRAWLFQVVRNLARETTRTDHRRRDRERRAAADECVVGDALRLEARDVATLVDDLPPELREVLVARLWGELTLAETAELVGTSVATAHRRYQSALAELQRRIEPCRTNRRIPAPEPETSTTTTTPHST